MITDPVTTEPLLTVTGDDELSDSAIEALAKLLIDTDDEADDPIEGT